MKAGDRVKCVIHYNNSKLVKLPYPVFGEYYTISYVWRSNGSEHLYFDGLPHGYPLSYFVNITEQRRNKLKKIL